MVLSDGDIKRAINLREIKIEPALTKDQIQPATVDSPLGGKIFKTVPEPTVKVLSKGEFLNIEPSEFVEVLTYEYLELSNQISGRFGLKSEFTRKGLMLFSGPQIDPTFRGVLSVSLYNTSTRPITIMFKQTFCSVEFSRLDSPSESEYTGRYLEQTDFNPEDISWLMTMKGMTFAQVVESVKGLQDSVKRLDTTVITLDTTFKNLRGDIRTYIVVLGVIIAVVSLLARFL